MADVAWSVGIPLPLVGQQVEWSSPVRVTNVMKGPPIVERWTDDQAYTFSVTWNLSAFEWRLMQGFIYTKLLNGSKWFDIGLNLFHDSQGQLTTCEANFMSAQPKTSQVRLSQIITAMLTVSIVKDLRDSAAESVALIDLVNGRV